MNLLEIFKLLFTKIADAESVNKYIDSLLKIPKLLKHMVLIVIVVGMVYFGYSKAYTYEINILHEEVTNLLNVIVLQVNKDEYQNEIYYIIDAIMLCEEINKYAYEEEQLLLDLIYTYLKRHNPNDPILIDIDAMKKRNQYLFEKYSSEFEKTLGKCRIHKGESENKLN